MDCVFDPVGGALLTEAIRCCCWGAQLLIIGFASGHIPKIAANVALVCVVWVFPCVGGARWGSSLSGGWTR